MKILIVSLCKLKLSDLEFVRPVEKIVESLNLEFRRISFWDLKNFSLNDINCFNKIVLCGTALMDFDYLNNFDNFEILKKFEGDLLGICAGSQVLSLLFGGSLLDFEEIGLKKIEILKENVLINKEEEIYCLHKKSCDVENNINFEVLAKTQIPQIFKVRNKNFYGVLFHPECRNIDVLKNFLEF